MSVRMCAPSTSASVITMSLWYRAFARSKSSPMPVPIAVIIAWTSVLPRTLSKRAFSTLMIFPRRGRIAWKLDWRPLCAEPPAESPSTRKSSVFSGSRSEQSASLPGRPVLSIAPLRRARSRALRAASARLRGAGGLVHDRPGLGRVLLEVLGQALGHRAGHEAGDLGVAELGLGLALELRLAQLHRDDRGEPLAGVRALQVLVLLLEQALGARVVVEGAREGRPEAREVRAALVGVDVVGERVDRLGVGGGPLQGDLERALGPLERQRDHVPVDGVAVLVEVPDEVLDAALVLELDLAAGVALVDQADEQPAREEGGLAEALGQRVEVEVRLLEDVRVRLEADRGAGGGRGRRCAASARAGCRARTAARRCGRRGTPSR